MVRLRKECLNRNHWNTLFGARVVIRDFKDEHNHRHRHSALGYRTLAESLELIGSERVLELGPGSGYFSVEVARRIPDGRLDLFDLQPEMLDKARRKLAAAGFRNVGAHAGEASDGLPFTDDEFDVAYLASVIGEVPDKPACIRSLARVVKPGGLLVFFEGFPDQDRLSVAELRVFAEPEGFEFVSATGSRWQDIVRFKRSA
jgi:ubiquinone/menaquinone biosynthesis C-methylase UbiE